MSIYEAFNKIVDVCDESVQNAVSHVQKELVKKSTCCGKGVYSPVEEWARCNACQEFCGVETDHDCRTTDGDGCAVCVQALEQKENSPKRVPIENIDTSIVAGFDRDAQIRTNMEAMEKLEANIGYPFEKNFTKDPVTNMQLLTMSGYRCATCGGYVKSSTFMYYDYRDDAKCWSCQHANK